MEEMYYYWLHNIYGIGRGTFHRILNYMTPKELYECNIEKTKEFLSQTERIRIKESKKKWDIYKEYESLTNRGIHLLGYGQRAYPEKLSAINDPPPILYHKGKMEILDKPSIAVIGARVCSNYGSLAAKELGRELANMGIVVISGMARGIDSICQWSVLEQEGESIGVLGSGVEVCYPAENKKLYERLQSRGAVVSENPPFTPPAAGLFPLRNRIISGLADMIVVVESREKSGTQITVDMALEQGKEVYAMPGRITDPISQGCNKLIKQGAGVILSPREFVEEVCPMLKLKYQCVKKEPEISLIREEKLVVDILNVSLMTIEEIYQHAKEKEEEISINKIMEIVVQLQIKDILKEESGYYRLNSRFVLSYCQP